MEDSITYQLSDSTQNIDIYALRYEHVALFVWKLKQIQPTGEVSFINEPNITLTSWAIPISPQGLLQNPAVAYIFP
jgi:hypothetical protein